MLLSTFASLNDGTKNQVVTLFRRRHDDIKVLCKLKGMAPIALKYTGNGFFLADSLMCLKLTALVILNYKQTNKKKKKINE